MESSARCAGCDEPIGLWERMVVIGPEGTRLTSLTREPDLPVSDRLLFHVECAADGAVELPA